MPKIEVNVDWDTIADQLDEGTLAQLARERDLELPKSERQMAERMWQAFYLGNDVLAMQIARQLAEAVTGRMVPVRIVARAPLAALLRKPPMRPATKRPPLRATP